MDALSDLRGRRVLITGAAGFLGQRFAEYGERLGAEVYRLRRPHGAPGGERVLGADVRDAASVQAAVDRARPEYVMHLAAAGVSGSGLSLAEQLEVDGGGTARLLQTLAAAGGVPVVMAGTAFEYRMADRPLREDDPCEPPVAYGVSKAAGALAAGWYARDMPITILRLFNVYGAGEPLPRLFPSIVRAARTRRALDLSPCTQIRDYTYVEDVARLFWLALADPPPVGSPRVLNVGSGRPAPLRRFVDELAVALRERGLEPDLRIGASPGRPGEPTMLVPDLTRLAATLPWSATTTFEDGIRRTLDAVL